MSAALLAAGLTAMQAGCVGCAASPRPKPQPGVSTPEDLAALADSSFRLELIADHHLAAGTTLDSGAAVGGLSGLFFDPASRDLLAICDDQRDHRYFVFDIGFGPPTLTVRPRRAIRLKDPPPGGPPIYDPEGLVLTENDTLIISTEGRANEEPRYPPVVAEYDRDGNWMKYLPVPERFVPERQGPQMRGVRNNFGFESLTLSPDGSRLFAAAESALIQDGTAASFEVGTRARIVVYEGSVLGFEPARELVYPVEATPTVDFEVDFSVNGLVDLLALSPTELLALERSYTQERVAAGEIPRGAYSIRLYRVSIGAADDVSMINSLADATPVPVSKRLLLDLADLVPGFSPGFRRLDNFEGMGLGPILDDGSPSVIIVSDDNFNPRQRSAFLLLRFVEV